MENFIPGCYETLELNKSYLIFDSLSDTVGEWTKIGDRDVKKAWKRLSLRYHPDKNLEEDTTEIMKKINVAYSLLKTESLRRGYDSQELLLKEAERRRQREEEAERRRREEEERAEEEKRRREAEEEKRRREAEFERLEKLLKAQTLFFKTRWEQEEEMRRVADCLFEENEARLREEMRNSWEKGQKRKGGGCKGKRKRGEEEKRRNEEAEKRRKVKEEEEKERLEKSKKRRRERADNRNEAKKKKMNAPSSSEESSSSSSEEDEEVQRNKETLDALNEEVDSDGEYHFVDEIVGVRWNSKDEKEYLVKWEKWEKCKNPSNTWEPAENLDGCNEAKNNFNRKLFQCGL